MGTLVAATKIWTGEALTGAAVEGSRQALGRPAYGAWWGAGEMTPPTGPLCRAAQPAGPPRVTSTPASQVDAPKQQRSLFPHDLWHPSNAVSTGT